MKISLLRTVGTFGLALVFGFTAAAPAQASKTVLFGLMAGLGIGAAAHAVVKSSGTHTLELYSKVQLSQSLAPCADQFPDGVPLNLALFPTERLVTGLCSNHFAVVSSKQTKTPVVVIERLNSAQMAEAKDEERTNAFYPDPRLKNNERANLDDFKGSGFDRGHLSPAGDAPDHTAMAQSFALSNMVPQDPTNNRKTWAKIESDVRKYVRRAKGEVFVFSGPLFRGQVRTIGRGQVWVPSHLFKLVYDQSSGRSWAYILENTAQARVGAPVDYDQFVRETGLNILHGSKTH